MKSPASMISSECNGFRSFFARVLLSSFLPLVLIFLLAFMYTIFLALDLVFSKSGRTVTWLRIDFNGLFSFTGALLVSFFVGIAANAFELMITYKHPLPNPALSLVSQPDVLFLEEIWRETISVSILS